MQTILYRSRDDSNLEISGIEIINVLKSDYSFSHDIINDAQEQFLKMTRNYWKGRHRI